ncbi:hypothetical protein GCM10007881_24060 [Mesorhizobium huakuii]|nr:hypothetical protein GCM10007881_24060 [Mesorhizobium huakuii]
MKAVTWGLEALQIIVVVDLDRGVLDRSRHPLGLTIGPRMIAFGRPVFDAIDDAGAVEDVRTQEASAGMIATLAPIGESHAVVGEHGVDLERETSTRFLRKAAPRAFPR